MSVRSLRYNTIEQHFTKGVTASTDRDALAFLEAAQIYNTNQQRAIVNLVRSLKRVGLWSKMKAIYPFVGGTASSHKWNLKDPRDSNAAYRLVFNGGFTHTANGILPNGTNGYAETYFTPNTGWTDEKGHIGFYSRTNNTFQAIDIGLYSYGDGYTYLYTYQTGSPPSGRDYRVNASSASNARLVPAGRTDGLFIGSRTSTTSTKGYRNGVVEVTDTNSSSAGRLTGTIAICALKEFGSPAGLYSNRQLAFANIGDGLTDTDATNLYNIVDLYQKRLGRAV